jgi:lysyl-tRNA synthetase class 2
MADLKDKAPAPELHLDEVTGENVSKTELKKRQKQRQKDAEKAQRLASRPAAGPKKTNAENEEKELNPNVFSSAFFYAMNKAADIDCIAIL